jgi:malate dehydrogenase
MKKSSAASAANAACDHIHDWWVGTKPGEYVSMGVVITFATHSPLSVRTENGKL